MKQFHEKFTYSHSENLYFSKCNSQSLDPTCDKICVGNVGFFYFKDDGKLYLYYKSNRKCYIIKNTPPVPFIECNEMNGKKSNVIGL